MESGYAWAQLARAFVTSQVHEDADTRRRAEVRVDRWRQVSSGMADGTLTIGSRTPVKGLPVWVTPEVVRGGFATGKAAAGGPLLEHETATAERAGIPANRRALFAYHLTEAGLEELYSLLDSGAYDVAVPEEAALLTVAWLVRAGDRLGALTLLDTLEPFCDRLRFLPRPGIADLPDSGVAHRQTAGEARAGMAARRPNQAIEANREALLVWNPFADELLAHWLDEGSSGWHARGEALLDRYQRLAAAHRHCSKHRKPKENLGILRISLEEAVAGRELTAKQRGLLKHAIAAMVRRRGAPGSAPHAALRSRQAADAAPPTLHALAQVLVRRLSVLPQEAGIPDVEEILEPVDGTPIPPRLRTIVERALSAPIRTLIERGIVTSAEVLAELIPQLVGATTARDYPGEALQTLVAANYRAFRNRRSLLLLNLAHQVQIGELPWVQALLPHRQAGDGTAAKTVLLQVAELALDGFPGTILPNPLISELTTLARQAGEDVPFTEELAADIFMGEFSKKYLRAAQLAATLLEGTLYERYYAIDYRAIRNLASGGGFGALCHERARNKPGWSVAANGKVIEQAQILTTHNLAALVTLGVRPDWTAPAERAFDTAAALSNRIPGNPRPLAMIKDAAYAWRQMIFFLSLTDDHQGFVSRMSGRNAPRLAPALTGLQHVISGRRNGLRFTGWTTGRHWLRD